MKKITKYFSKIISQYSEKKLLEDVVKNKKKIYIIFCLLLFVAFLYGISNLPYFNLYIPKILLVHGFFISSILVINPRPQSLIKIIIALFILLIIPVSLGMQSLPEQIGNFIYVLLLIAVVLYVKKMRTEK